MSIINAIVQFVMDLGGGVFLPFTILILGIIFKQKPFDALRNGLRVGAGFLGINVILNMLISGLQPAIDYYAQYGDGAGFTIVDIGWEGLAAVAWSTSFALLIVPLGMILNYVLIKVRFTKTMDIDVWNYFHMVLGASMLYYVLTIAGMAKVPAYIIATVFGLLTVVVVLVFADKIAAKWQKVYNLPGTTCCNHDMIYILAIDWVVCKVLDKIPGINKIHLNVNWFSEKFGSFGESSIMAFTVGLILSVLTKQSVSGTLTLSVTLAAAIILIAILIAFLPGVHMFPLSTLGSMVYITCACAMYANGDMFKALIASIAVVVYKTYINTWMAPIVTELAFGAGFISSTATMVSGSNAAEFNCVLVGILGKFLKVW